MNKKSRIFLVTFIILLLLLGIYMGLKYKDTVEEGELLEQRLDDRFTAIISGDAKKLGVNPKLENNRIFKSVLGSINFMILDNKTTSKTSDITVNIQTRNFKDLFTKMIKKTIEIDKLNATKPDNEKLTPEEAEFKLGEYVDELIISEEIEYINKEYIFHFVKEDGEWKLTNSKDEIVSTILGGIGDKDSLIEELQNELVKEMK